MMMQIPDFINDTYVLRLTFKSQMSMALYVFAFYVYFDAFLAYFMVSFLLYFYCT